MAQLLLQADCTVTIAHSRTQDLPGVCRQADILVAAVGRPEMVKGDWIKPGAIVIDVGINRLAPTVEGGKGKIVGDVAFEEAKQVAGAITPVARRRRADDHRLPAQQHPDRRPPPGRGSSSAASGRRKPAGPAAGRCDRR